MLYSKIYSCNILGAEGRQDEGQGPRVEEHNHSILKVIKTTYFT